MDWNSKKSFKYVWILLLQMKEPFKAILKTRLICWLFIHAQQVLKSLLLGVQKKL